MSKNIKKEVAKGFTIIELVVVIAIIAVLATIVMVNVTLYNQKGKNAAIKGNAAGLITKGLVYFESDPTYKGSYQNFCGSSAYIATRTAIVKAGGTGNVCACDGDTGDCSTIVYPKTSITAWCFCTQEIPTTTRFCVDSTGVKKETTHLCDDECYRGYCEY